VTNSLHSLFLWLENQIQNAEYSDISIQFKVHAGKITLIERTVSEKLKELETYFESK